MKPGAPLKLDELTVPKPSVQAAQLLQALSREDVDLHEIDRLILHDPVLAGVIIRYANSPLYRRGDEIANVPAATRLIGLKNIRSAVVMATLNSAIAVNTPAAQRIQAHSLAVARLGKLIARQACPELADDLELIGLLHDVGMVVLVSNFPEEYAALLEQALRTGEPLDVLEVRQFHLSHDQINARALHDFRLPLEDADLLGHFHLADEEEDLSTTPGRIRAILALAHHVLAEYDADAAIPESLSSSKPRLIEQLGIDADQLQQDYLRVRQEDR